MFLEEMSVVPQSLVLLGDFNVHMDIPDKWDTKRLNNTILLSTGFRQFIDKRTSQIISSIYSLQGRMMI